MNKNLKLIFLFASLVTLTVVTYYLTKDDSTVISNEALSNFAIEDTSTIDRLEFSNTSDQQIAIEREGNKWMEENGMAIDQNMVQTVLKTIKRIQVKSPIPESSHETVINQIIGGHVKLNIFQNGKLVKTYYVGHPTSDHYGTYMLLETPHEGRSPEPFIMYLPGHPGHLSTRFVADPAVWRFSGIYNIEPLNIEQVTYKDYNQPQNSFSILALGENTFNLLDQFEKSTYGFDTVLVRDYLTRYRKVHYNFVEKNLTEEMQDSILNSRPFASIEVVQKSGNTKKVDCYRRPPRKKEVDLEGNPIPYDRDLFIGQIDDSELVVCQYYVFDKLFMRYKDFLSPSSLP